MKKHLKLIALLFAMFNIGFSGKAQITLEHTYPIILPESKELRLVRLGLAGEKFALIEYGGLYGFSAFNIKLYNLNHSIYKTITIPKLLGSPNSPAFFPVNISDNLFNSNTNIEYSVYYAYSDSTFPTPYSVYALRIYDEAGSVLLSKDSVVANIEPSIYYSNVVDNNFGLVKASTGTKLFVMNNKARDRSTYVYALPGNLISALAPNPSDLQHGFLSYPAPNPSMGMAKIQFELPPNVERGEISIYNTLGRKLKTYQVDRTFGDLILDENDLPIGNYIYHLVAGGQMIGSKKMMIAR